MKFLQRIARIFPSGSLRALKPAREAGLLPSFPFGSDFTDVEQRLIPALQFLQDAQRAPLRLAGLLWQGLTRSRMRPTGMSGAARPRPPRDLSERAYRALVSAALVRAMLGPSCVRVIAGIRAYLFLFTGLRFSMNAAMPSERSSSAKVE